MVEILAPLVSGATPVLRDLSVIEALLLRRHRPRPPGRETGSRIRYRTCARSRRARGSNLPLRHGSGARSARAAPTPSHGPRRACFGDPGRARRIPGTGAPCWPGGAGGGPERQRAARPALPAKQPIGAGDRFRALPFRPAPSRRTCVTSTASSTFTAAPRRWSGPVSSDCSGRPPESAASAHSPYPVDARSSFSG